MKLKAWLQNNYWLIIILLAGSFLRLYHLDLQSPWLDEIHSLKEANPAFSLAEIKAAVIKSEQQPPLYFIILSWLFKAFGYTSLVLRLFSAVTGILAIFGIYVLVRELFNKKAGLYAAALLAVNFFHIYYSQEGRMYTFLVLTTILSFYCFTRFIKKPAPGSAFIYMLASTLMIYSHFFGLFTLVAQYLVLLLFIVKPYNTTRGRFFIYCAASGILTVLLYLPAIGLLAKTSGIRSSWIPPLEADVYTQLFKEFFGHSEVVIFFVALLMLVFFTRVFKDDTKDNAPADPEKNRLVFIFIVTVTWIAVTILITFIRSHLVLPMVVSRYFISLVPAIIIIIATGLFYIRSGIARGLVLGIIIIFSLTDAFAVKKHYTATAKMQFREAANYIIEKNKNDEPVVSELGWYYDFFLNSDKVKTTVIDQPLEAYIGELMKDTTKIGAFWYAHARTPSVELSPVAQQFLESHFVMSKNKAWFKAFASHYEPSSSASLEEADLSRYKPLSYSNGNAFRYYVNSFDTTAAMLKSTGFAFYEGEESADTELEIVLVKDEKAFKVPSQMERRDDNTTYFKSSTDLGNSGYLFTMFTQKLTPGRYRLGIILKNATIRKEGLMLTDYYYNKY